MPSLHVKWWHGLFVGIVLLLAGCSDSVTAPNDATATTAEEQESTTTTTESVDTTSEPSAEPAEEAAGNESEPVDTVSFAPAATSTGKSGRSRLQAL